MVQEPNASHPTQTQWINTAGTTLGAFHAFAEQAGCIKFLHVNGYSPKRVMRFKLPSQVNCPSCPLLVINNGACPISPEDLKRKKFNPPKPHSDVLSLS